MPKLVITSPDGASSELEMREQTILIGREGDVELVLDSIEVSRKHARISLTGAAWKIEDLGSANGTSVNGRTIKSPTELTNKARIEIAGYQLLFEDEAGRAGPNPVLIGQGPPVQNKTFVLPMGDLEIGRVEGNAIVIADASISRKHARLRVSGQQVRVEDLGSSNGTRVNGENVQNHLLQPGDEVQFGKVSFDFSYTDSGKASGARGGLISQLQRADTSFKLAAGIGIFSIGLLLASLVVALKRNQAENSANSTPTASLHTTFETRISVGLLEAENLETRSEWRAAVSSFESVLDRDPINERARDGLARTRAILDDQRSLARAKETMEQEQFAATIRSAERVRATGPLGPEAKDIITRASKKLATRALKDATKACKRREWRICQKSAIRAAQLTSSPERAKALIVKAELALTRAKVVFIPAALLLP